LAVSSSCYIFEGFKENSGIFNIAQIMNKKQPEFENSAQFIKIFVQRRGVMAGPLFQSGKNSAFWFSTALVPLTFIN
jgi:hypothetical protein